ncbi:MAG: sodium:proton exchanger [bacterium]|nr:sodium:proton exchanger [bacterium]
MELSGLISVSLIVFAYGVVSRYLGRWAITAPMVFLLAGWVIGPDGLAIVDIGFEEEGVRLLAEATLVLVLFSDATRIDVGIMRRNFPMPGRLLGIGLPLTIISGGGLAAWLIPGVSIAEGFLIGAILAPTDAALGKAVITNRLIPARTRQTLNVESGLNDGIALPVVTALVAVAAAGANSEGAGHWVQVALREIGLGVTVGLAVGAAGGMVLNAAWERDWVSGASRQLATLSVAVMAFAVTESISGNGFIATFVAGIAFRAAVMEMHDTAADLTEDLGELATWVTFLFFGVGLVIPAIRAATPATVFYVFLSLTVVRMIPAALSLFGTHCAPSTALFLGWFGPRGLASILFALLIVAEADLTGESVILTTVSLTVLASVFLHGITARKGAALYVARSTGMHDGMPEMLPVDEMADMRRGGLFS